ncbi:sensor histidine kinase [uncultured Microbacterium sp.]|uniref:sensor histidine kinase n=1 Tax=uncultured Microbacterium sp. TaxID=191216 RepID=UPI0025F8C7A2|nr:histidine kinase [uncultured Microbacterium sp.]
MRALPGGLRVRDVVIDVGVLLLVSLAAFAPFSREPAAPHGWTVLPGMVLAGVVLLARRRLPLTVLVVCVAIGPAAMLLGQPYTPAFALPVAIAMYTVARHRSRAVTVTAAAALVVLLPIEELVGRGLDAAELTSPATLQPAVLIAFAAALGSAIRSYFDALESARERARKAEESRESEARRRVAEDRLAIARDLHDSVAHRIAVINLQTGVAARSLRSDPAEAEEAITIVGDAARSVLTELNDMLGLLRTTAGRDIVDEPDFGRIEGLLALFARSGLKVHVRVDGTPRPLDGRLGAIAYRVVQEGLTNAYKHGADRTAELQLDYAEEGLIIRITNPLSDPPAPIGADGHGLVGMRERLEEVDGGLALDTTEGRFRVVATLPGGAA